MARQLTAPTVKARGLLVIQCMSTKFIVCGTHISENLQHHKVKDVERILEDKGFEKSVDPANQSVSYFKQAGAADGDKRTVIVFGDGGFVLEKDGVCFYDKPEAMNE